MKVKKILERGRYLIIALFLWVCFCFISVFTIAVKAEETLLDYEETNVLEDLRGMTVNGEPFDVMDYAYDETRDVQIVSFVEYCYSSVEDKQSDFGLYVYIWNPKGLSFTNDETRNRIQFTYGENTAPEKYALTILSKSEESGYEGLFYKLRVELTEDQRTHMLTTLNSVSRRYCVSGIELLQEGNATAKEYTVATTFTYTGFAEGYGAEDADGSMLTCIRDSSEVLEIEVHPTYYRPSGSNGTNSYTQDTLMSVYFSISNDLLDSYDRLSGLECSWIKVLTDWAYVTGNKAVYDAFLPYVGKTELYDDNGTPYVLIDDLPLEYAFVGQSIEGDYIVSYNADFYDAKETISQLDYLFFSEEGIDSADNYIVTSEEIQAWMETYYERYVTEESANQNYLTVDGASYHPYAQTLFSQPKAYTTQVMISADDEYSLTEEVITANWWQKIWGNTTLESSTTFDGIEAIHKVTAEDMEQTADELCGNLYISLQDVSEFQRFYGLETGKDRSVFLLRYDIGTYEALEASQGTVDDSGLVVGVDNVDTNARVFRQNVYLNFDVIYAEFEKGGDSVIIPVVSSPADIIPDSTPPLHTESDKELTLEDILTLVLGLGGLIILLVIFSPLFPKAFKGLVALLALPFKGLAKLFKGKKQKYEDDWDDWDGWEDFFNEDG